MLVPMITCTLVGARYRLIAELDLVSLQCAEFTVRAIHIATGHTSVVNQLNVILCHFFPGGFPQEAPWKISWLGGLNWMRLFAQIAQTSVASTWNQMAYLEDRLDEDRREGEWTNVVPVEPDRMSELAREFLDDEDNAEMRVVLNDPDSFQSFVNWLNNDQGQWLVDNWNSWRQRGVRFADEVKEDDDAE